MEPTKKLIGGDLLPLTPDKRDFAYELSFGAVALKYLPTEDFRVGEPLGVKDQKGTDRCSGYGSTAASELQEGIRLNPDAQFGLIKAVMGDEAWGADPRSALESYTKYGSIPAHRVTFTADTPREDILNIKQWFTDSLKVDAEMYKKESFFWIKGPYDMYDSIRSALVQHKHENTAVHTGALWRGEWTDAPGGLIPDTYGDYGGAHYFIIIGQKTFPGEHEPRLEAQLSNGNNIGDNGFFYFTRAQINKELLFAAMFKDLPDGETKDSLIEKNLWRNSNPFMKLWLFIRSFFIQ